MPLGLSGTGCVAPSYERLLQPLISEADNHFPCYLAACPCEQHQTTIKRHPAPPQREHQWRISENLLVNKVTFETGEKTRERLPAAVLIIMGKENRSSLSIPVG